MLGMGFYKSLGPLGENDRMRSGFRILVSKRINLKYTEIIGLSFSNPFRLLLGFRFRLSNTRHVRLWMGLC